MKYANINTLVFTFEKMWSCHDTVIIQKLDYHAISQAEGSRPEVKLKKFMTCQFDSITLNSYLM